MKRHWTHFNKKNLHHRCYNFCRDTLGAPIGQGIIETFVGHYAALGFQKLLLYFDDPEDVSREVLEESGWIAAGFVEIVMVIEYTLSLQELL